MASSSARASASYGTYEAKQARQSTLAQSDKIHWNSDSAYRSCPYRQLHHQEGIIGTFTIRLLEASNLKRSYWSALALGPIKHLGLSKAHGPISSFASFSLGHSQEEEPETMEDVIFHANQKQTSKKMMQQQRKTWESPSVVSPVVPDNDNPVWPACELDLPLSKGGGGGAGDAPSSFRDGKRIQLNICMEEDATAADRILPMGVVPSREERLLGQGCLDVTSLLLGVSSESSTNNEGMPQVGVMDVWIPIHRPGGKGEKIDNGNEDDDALCKKRNQTTSTAETGQIRVLISYQPHGLEPEHNDWVALETFARRSLRHSSCQPLLPPLAPMRVANVRGSFLLVEYDLHASSSFNSSNQNNKGKMRVHRNAVFVIERTSMMDGIANLALLPTDLFLSTPLGQTTVQVAMPIVSTVGDILMPALLTSKLLVNVLKTTGTATLSGVQAGVSAVAKQSQQDQERRRREAHFRTAKPTDDNDDNCNQTNGGRNANQHSHGVPHVPQQYRFV